VTYRPLPESLTIKESSIEGLGLFATKEISKGTDLGISHISDVKFENGYIRTPIGAFVNHSDKPNCEFVREQEFDSFNPPIAKNGSFIYLKTIKDISEGTELLVTYWLYQIKREENE
jgi:SET domain-containing protein